MRARNEPNDSHTTYPLSPAPAVHISLAITEFICENGAPMLAYYCIYFLVHTHTQKAPTSVTRPQGILNETYSSQSPNEKNKSVQ